MVGKRKTILSIIALLLMIGLVFSLSGCGGGEDEGAISETPSTNAPSDTPSDTTAGGNSSEAAKIIEVTNAYLASGRAPTISVEDVNKAITDGDTSYFLLSVRKPEDYAKGHIQGAINIPYGEVYKKENIDKLPKDKKIVVICYTGHTASQVSMFLNQLGYEAYAMKFGMMGWTSKEDVLATKPFTKAPDFEVDNAAVEAQATNELPAVASGKTEVSEIILAQTEKYLTSGKAPTISAEDVNKAVKDGDNSYFILSVRKPEDYAKGHVKGAINIPYAELAKEENLKKLPADKKIVVICYTGHTASYATMFLNQLGYEAYAMKFGMMGWTSDQDVLALKPFTKAPDFPTVTGN